MPLALGRSIHTGYGLFKMVASDLRNDADNTVLGNLAMPYAVKPLRSKEAPTPWIDYYHPLFEYLHDRHNTQIRRALFAEPKALRARTLGRRLKDGLRTDFDAAFELIFPYLGEIEENLKQIISRRSTAYWFHLYRRLAPFLSPEHEGKTDFVTTVLVRQVADLSIVKYGRKTIDHDLVSSREIEFGSYLRGLYHQAFHDLSLSEDAGRALLDQTRNRAQWVIGDLSPSDFIDVYRIEGLSYEYWRTNAALRAVGKKVDVTWRSDKCWFDYHLDRMPMALFDRYDHRLGQKGGLATAFGTWFHDVKEYESFDYFAWAQYSQPDKQRRLELPSASGEPDIVHVSRNFSVGRASIQSFWDQHAFANDDFTQQHGISLSAVLFALWVISVHATVPNRFFENGLEEIERIRILYAGEINLIRRGYSVYNSTSKELIQNGLTLAPGLKYPLTLPSEEEAIAAIEFLSFKSGLENQVALWAGGKRYPVVPHDNLTLLDIAAVPKFLEGLFFRVGDKSKLKGPAFESTARSVLTDAGFEIVRSGRIRWQDGVEREIDAAVRVGDTLVVFECVSAERPLDFELTRPRTFARRIEILSEKLQQAESLAAALELERVGRNFDFSWAAKIDWRVISPHHEFLWSEKAPCFSDDGSPRILDPALAIEFLNTLASPG